MRKLLWLLVVACSTMTGSGCGSAAHTGLPTTPASGRVIELSDFGAERNDGISLTNAAGERYFFGDQPVLRYIRQGRRILLSVHGHTDQGLPYVALQPLEALRTVAVVLSGRPRDVTEDVKATALRFAGSQRRAQCSIIPWSHARGVRTLCGDDPGPCVDCSGPMAPDGYLACHYSSYCGGGDGGYPLSGIGIVRFTNPQLSCYFDFVGYDYADCYADGIDNTDNSGIPNLLLDYGWLPNEFRVDCDYFSFVFRAQVFAEGFSFSGTTLIVPFRVEPGTRTTIQFKTIYGYGNSIESEWYQQSRQDALKAVCNGAE